MWKGKGRDKCIGKGKGKVNAMVRVKAKLWVKI